MSETPVSAEPAGLGRRIGAMVYDGLLLTALWMINAMVFVTIQGAAVVGPGFQTLLFLETFAFFAYFWRRDGQTLGMLAWQLRVVSNDSERLTLSQVAMRIGGALLSFIPFGLGYLWALVDPLNRTWGDLMSDSRVVFEPKPKG